MCEALKELMKDLDRAKARADREGWIDADEAELIYIAQSGVKETSRCYYGPFMSRRSDSV